MWTWEKFLHSKNWWGVTILTDNLDKREKKIAAEAVTEATMKKTPSTTTRLPLTQLKPNENSLPSSNFTMPLQLKLSVTTLSKLELSLPAQSNLSSCNLDYEKSHTTGISKSYSAKNSPSVQGNKKGLKVRFLHLRHWWGVTILTDDLDNWEKKIAAKATIRSPLIQSKLQKQPYAKCRSKTFWIMLVKSIQIYFI